MSGLKAIAPVPTANDFLDIVLSKTQRKTPTVIHKNFKISRIRNFYMRKVKFTQDSFDEKLEDILTSFPVLDALHPFHSSLLNVLYDKNHYKLALGQLRTAKGLISQVAKDYLRLLKFGDSLYRCKQLKRAAMGRMATIMRRQKDPLEYLEQVRQHLGRLPNIDPMTRTLIVCGYPNVGKSSFVNKVTRADVDVQPYAFTTKSLFVGHLDYKYLRWQVIDTPGILDHPLEEMNTIEMQSITALAHLKACVMYFMDLSEQCGYTVQAQCTLFQSILPLFAHKPVILVLNKVDVTRISDLPAETAEMVKEVIGMCSGHVETSTYTEEGVMSLKNTACDTLLAHRVEGKMKGNKVDSIINRIHVAQPKTRDEVERPAFIPPAIQAKRDKMEEKKKWDRHDPDRKRLLRDREEEEGGAGIFSINMKESYLLANPEWKEDVIPEIMDGKNVADFIDPDIEEKLEALEREEERLQAEGYYDSDASILDSDDEAYEALTHAQNLSKGASQQNKKGRNNNSVIPKNKKAITMEEMSESIRKAGFDPSKVEERARFLTDAAKARRKERVGDKRKRDGDDEGDVEMGDAEEDAWEDEGMDVDGAERTPSAKKSKTSATTAVATKKRVPRSNRQLAGMRDEGQASKADELRNLAQRPRNMLAKASESDRAIRVKKPKHLFAGKRKAGKTDRR